MKFGSFGNIISSTFTDKLSVHRFTELTNDDGTVNPSGLKTLVHDRIACRISFNQADSSESSKEDTNPIYLAIKLFCDPGIDIRKGDDLKAEKIKDDGSVMYTYEGNANLPHRFTTHQEILMTETGDA